MTCMNASASTTPEDTIKVHSEVITTLWGISRDDDQADDDDDITNA